LRKLSDALEYASSIFISSLFGVLAILSQHAEGAIREINMQHGIIEKLFYITYSISYYVVGVFLPVNLSAIHPYPKYINGMLPVEYYLSPLLVLLIIWLVYKSRKKNKDIVFGSLFFIITLGLVIQIIPLGQAIVAERYTYIPYIGAFFIAGRYYTRIYKRRNKVFNPLFLVLAVFAIYFSITTFKRNMVWRDSLSLFTDASSKNPGENSLIYNNLGTSKFNAGDYEGAIEAFNKAIELGVSDEAALNNRGSAKFLLGRLEEALEDFNMAIKLKPDFSDPYRNRGVIWYKQNNFPAAIEDFNRCLELNPEDGITYYYRGIAKSKLNDMPGACNDWQQAAKLGVENATKRIEEHCQ
jgi:tetratricopeptide (TPR) repeat protein